MRPVCLAIESARMNLACLTGGSAGMNPRQHVPKTVFASNLRRKWQKIAVMNDYFDKKAEKPGKTAKFSTKIVHNRKKVTENCFFTVIPE